MPRSGKNNLWRRCCQNDESTSRSRAELWPVGETRVMVRRGAPSRREEASRNAVEEEGLNVLLRARRAGPANSERRRTCSRVNHMSSPGRLRSPKRRTGMRPPPGATGRPVATERSCSGVRRSMSREVMVWVGRRKGAQLAARWPRANFVQGGLPDAQPLTQIEPERELRWIPMHRCINMD